MRLWSYLLLGIAIWPGLAAMQPERVVADVGLSGSVIASDAKPVSGGSVLIQSSTGTRTTSPIDETGHFRVIPNSPGLHQLVVSVPGHAPYRLGVSVPRSRTLKLPLIRLSPATYFRVRFVSAAGEPLVWPQLHRRSFDAAGPVFALPDDHVSDRVDGDGTITIGPLPRGLTTLALDTPSLAQTRLPDLYVTGEKALFDGGTVVVQPGAVLHIDVVDDHDAPVPQHSVAIEDVRPLSPLVFRPVMTDREGRATFERLAAGRYRIRTTAVARCGNQLLSIAPVVLVPVNGVMRYRIIVAGHATFQLTSPFGSMRGVHVSASPGAGSSAPATAPLRSASPLSTRPIRETSCSGVTDSDGRVTLTNFPPGLTRVVVDLLNSRYERRVDVPIGGRQVAIVVPGGFLPVRISSADTNEQIPRATITWTSEGASVEALSSVTGEAMLEGVGTTGGTLTAEASGYKPANETVLETLPALHEVSLTRAATSHVQVRVVTASGAAVPDAVVELFCVDPMEIPRIATTNLKGDVFFADAPSGPLRLTASAEGYVTATVTLKEDRRSELVTLVRTTR